MKAGAERSWLSGGRGKKNKKNPAVIADRNCGRVTKIKCKELFLYHDKKINAEKLYAPQSVCENVKIFRIFMPLPVLTNRIIGGHERKPRYLLIPGFLFSMAEMCFMLFGRRISDFCTEWQVAVNLFRGRLYGKRWR